MKSTLSASPVTFVPVSTYTASYTQRNIDPLLAARQSGSLKSIITSSSSWRTEYEWRRDEEEREEHFTPTHYTWQDLKTAKEYVEYSKQKAAAAAAAAAAAGASLSASTGGARVATPNTHHTQQPPVPSTQHHDSTATHTNIPIFYDSEPNPALTSSVSSAGATSTSTAPHRPPSQQQRAANNTQADARTRTPAGRR